MVRCRPTWNPVSRLLGSDVVGIPISLDSNENQLGIQRSGQHRKENSRRPIDIFEHAYIIYLYTYIHTILYTYVDIAYICNINNYV